MSDVFADTHYFIALLGESGGEHRKAMEATSRRTGRLITTAWVLVEVANFLSPAKNRRSFLRLLATLGADPSADIIPADQALLDRGIELYGQRLDKDWSLTDCISFLVMQERHLIEALTADHHFEQAGFVALLK